MYLAKVETLIDIRNKMHDYFKIIVHFGRYTTLIAGVSHCRRRRKSVYRQAVYFFLLIVTFLAGFKVAAGTVVLTSGVGCSMLTSSTVKISVE